MIAAPSRKHLPETRRSVTHKQVVCGQDVYVIVGFYDSSETTAEEAATPGEVFVVVSKHGDVVSGLVDGLATAVSVALQHGVPWSVMREKFVGTRFGAHSPEHSSLLDGIAKMIDHCIEEKHRILGVNQP